MLGEEVGPAGVAAEPVGREELTEAPTTGVVVAGVTSGGRVVLTRSNAGEVKGSSPHASITVLPPSKVYLPTMGNDCVLLVLS